MSSFKIFIWAAFVLFGGIGAAAYVKKQKKEPAPTTVEVVATEEPPIEVPLASLQIKTDLQPAVKEEAPPQVSKEPEVSKEPAVLPIEQVDRVGLLYQKDSKLPIVETITYKSRVSWKQGRPAWLVDYASYHQTPLDFIARCLNESPNYTPPPATEGMRFNVLSKKIDFHFLLTVDLKTCSMGLYAVLPQKNEKIALKTYNVALGRPDSTKASRCLTPVGKYTLGSRILTIKPKQMGTYKGARVELIRVFGTRWIPFEKELEACSEPAKGFGIHGTPWANDPQTGILSDNTSSIGKYESDGCIRLKRQDMEELYSIISTRHTIIEIK